MGRTSVTDLNLNATKSSSEPPQYTPISELSNQPNIPVTHNTNNIPDSAVSPTVPVPEEEPSEIGEKKNPTLTIGNYDFDIDSCVVMLLLILIWSFIWKTSGLWAMLKYDITFIFLYFFFIIYCVLNMFTSGNTSGSIVYELNILMNVEQMVSILFGTMILFTLFKDRLEIHQGCKKLISHLMMSIVIIMTIISLWVNVFVSGRAFRALRKFKQGVYNISLMLFLITGLIYIKQTTCM